MKQGTVLGRPVQRVDGPAKVTGQARYAGDYTTPGLLHGYLVNSTVASGTVVSIDESAARKFPGVIEIFTHENRPELSDKAKDYNDEAAPPGEHFRPLHDERILFSDQPIALVVADSFEAARDAASLVRVTYDSEPHETDLDKAKAKAYKPPKLRTGIAPTPKPRGDFSRSYGLSSQRFAAEYETPFEHANPMEPFATTCIWNPDGSITVYDKTQGSQNCQQYVTNIFDFSKDDVRVVNSFVGGGFGSGLRPAHTLFFAVMASKALKRSLQIVLPREKMWGAMVHRPHTLNKVQFGATTGGLLEAIQHEAVGGTSVFEDHQEVVVNWTGLMYDCDNVELAYKLAKLNTYSPGDMRAPGAVVGQFASESAVDEFSYQLGIDPVEFRLKNYTSRDRNQDKAFTSKALREALRAGADAFGWSRRNPEPRSMREGSDLIGWGMANAAWEAMLMETSARASIGTDGRLTVASATSDIGTGSYTIMTQTGADVFGLPLELVTAQLGDSDLPKAPVEGGSWGAASTCSAVLNACEKLKKTLLSEAHAMPAKPIGKAASHEVFFEDGNIVVEADTTQRVSLAEIVRASGNDVLSAQGSVSPSMLQHLKWASYTHSAIFCEARVDEELGNVRISRIVCAVAAGRILNPKTARSQIAGGVIMAMGSALTEESMMDHNLGRFMNHNFGEYHVPVNADTQNIDVIFVEEDDDKVSPIGAKGLGEIGIVGTGAAIANAVFHATGRRVRTLPITVDKVLGIDQASWASAVGDLLSRKPVFPSSRS